MLIKPSVALRFAAATFLGLLGILILFAGCGRSESEAVAVIEIEEWSAPAAPHFASFVVDQPVDVEYFRSVDDDTPPQAFIRPPREAFAISEYGPVGELPAEVRRPTVFVVFTHPMVPLSRLGEPMKNSALMKISPALEGTYRWMGSRILSFQPDAPLEGQHEYTVQISNQHPALTGAKLEKPYSFSFYREALDMVAMYPGSPEMTEPIDAGDAPPELAREITIQFSYPVNIRYIQDFLQVKTGTANGQQKAVPFSLRRARNLDQDQNRHDRTVVLTLGSLLPENTVIEVRLLSGASSDAGLRGRSDDSTRTFHTLKPFQFRNHSSRSWYQIRSALGDSNPVFLNFSHPLADQDWRALIETDLEVEDISAYVELFGSTLRLNNLPVEYESRYTIRLLAGIKDIHGRSLAKDQELSIEVPKAASYFYSPNRGSRMLEAQFTPRIIYELQNPESGFWRAEAIEDPFASFPEQTLRAYNLQNIRPNTKHYNVLELSEFLNPAGYGFVGVSWNFIMQGEQRQRWRQVDLQLQVTDLGVTTRYAHNRLLVWVCSLTDGRPIEGARVRISPWETDPMRSFEVNAKTGKNGLAIIELKDGDFAEKLHSSGRERLQIEVQKDSDRVLFRPNQSHNAYYYGVYNQMMPAAVASPRAVPFMFTDRGLYKPGESVTFRLIDRDIVLGTYLAYSGEYRIDVREDNWSAQPFLTRTGRTGAAGGSWGEFALPEDIDPGSYVIEYRRAGMGHPVYREYFQIAHFKRAAFSVSVIAPAEAQVRGLRLSFPVSATYLAGGPVSAGRLEYSIMRQAVAWAPPGTAWEGFAFGPRGFRGPELAAEGRESLDNNGRALVGIDTGSEAIPGRAYQYRIEARVQDPARQELAGRAAAIVHPAEFYLGARLVDSQGRRRVFAQAEEQLRAELAAVDTSGRKTDSSHSVRVEWISRKWKSVQQRGIGGQLNTRYEIIEEILESSESNMRQGSSMLQFTPPEAGSYLLRVQTLDAEGRTVITELSFYAAGRHWVRWLSSNPDEIGLVPDRDRYMVGDTARIMVQAPVPDGRYLMSIEREGIIDQSFVDIAGSAGFIDIEIKDEYIPVVYMALSSSTPRAEAPVSYFEPDLGKPRSFFGIVELMVDPQPRMLDMKIETDRSFYAPGSQARARVQVTHQGRPVKGAEVTFMAVDRGVLDLIDYRVPDPLAYFYSPNHFPLGVRGADSRTLLIDPVSYEVKDLQGGGGEDEKMDERSDFRPLAVFEPMLITDSNGYVQVQFKWPDNLTTYRLTAVGMDTTRFGKAEHEVQVRNPVTVRAALPMQLRVRDTASLSLLLTNQTESSQSMTIGLLINGAGHEGLELDAPLQIELAAAETREVLFPVSFPDPGLAELVFSIRSAVLNERLRSTLPVVREDIREAFTLAGDLRETRVEEALLLPYTVLPGSGALELKVSGHQAGFLREPLLRWLDIRDYRSLDMRLYRAMPWAVFGQRLEEITTENPEQARRLAVAAFGSLASYQHRDGGFVPDIAMRDTSRSSAPRTTLTAAEMIIQLSAAVQAGDVPAADFEALSRVNQRSLRQRLSGLAAEERQPPFERAWALYCLARLDPLGRYNDLLVKTADLGDRLSVAGYALTAASAAILKNQAVANQALGRVKNLVQIGTRSVDFIETYESRNYFDSSLLRLSAVHQAFELLEPDSAIPMRILMAMQRAASNSYWTGSLENLFAAVSISREMRRSSGISEARIRVSAADEVLLSAEEAIQTGIQRIFRLEEEPLAGLKRGSILPLSFELDADSADSGALFYSAVLHYRLPSEVTSPRDEGFSVLRVIEDLEGNKVEFDKLTRGETYRIRVTVGSDRNRFAAFLRVPVPSGMEPLDGSLSATSSFEEAGGVRGGSWTRETEYGDTAKYSGEGYAYRSGGGWWLSWLQPQQRIYPGEVTWFFPQLYPGTRTVSFLARAVTPGIFPVPPAHIELEGEEEVFGRSPGALSVIE